MAGRGPAPKPAHLRQRTNRKPGAVVLNAEALEQRTQEPAIPNPDGREWHPLTEVWWQHVWSSAMAVEYLPTDVDGLGRVAILVDEFYRKPNTQTMAEIRLQEQRFGLSPLDRSRLQWEIKRAEDTDRTPQRPAARRPGPDPRSVLMAVK
jgi:hypothetical protein